MPAEHQIRGLGPITISVPDLKPTGAVLSRVLGMNSVRTYATPGGGNSTTHVYQMGGGGARGPFRLLEALCRHHFSADYTISMFGFDFRQGQVATIADIGSRAFWTRLRPLKRTWLVSHPRP